MTGLGVSGPLICLFSVEDIQIYDKINLKFKNVVVFIRRIGGDQAVNEVKETEFGEQGFVYFLTCCRLETLVRRNRNAFNPIIP